MRNQLLAVTPALVFAGLCSAAAGQKLPRSGSANASPVLLRINGQPQLILASGNNLLESLNPADGTTIWSFKRRMGDLSPVYADGILLTDCSGGPGLGLDPTGQGDVTKTHEKWRIEKTPARR